MTSQTGSSCVSEHITDIVELPTTNLGFRSLQREQRNCFMPLRQRPTTGNIRRNRKYLYCWNYHI